MAPRRTTARTADEVREAREAKLSELSGRLERAVGRLVSGDDWAAAVRFAARFRSRSFANTLLSFAQHQDAFEQGRVSEPFPSYVAGTSSENVGPSGRQGPGGVHDLRAGDGEVRDTNPPALYPSTCSKRRKTTLARQLDLVTARLDALDSTYEEARTHLI
jgi:hypothetical protein